MAQATPNRWLRLLSALVLTRTLGLEPMPLRKAPTARRAVLQHTTAALLAAAAAPAYANIGGADYVIGGARLAESISSGEGQVEAPTKPPMENGERNI